MADQLPPDEQRQWLMTIQRYFERDLGPEELQAFDLAMKQSEPLRRLFLQYSQQSAALMEVLGIKSYTSLESLGIDTSYDDDVEFMASEVPARAWQASVQDGSAPEAALTRFLAEKECEHQDVAERDKVGKNNVTAGEFYSLAGYLLRKALTSRVAYKAYAFAAMLILGVTLLYFLYSRDTTTDTDPLVNGPVQPSRADVALLTNEYDAVWDRQPGRVLYAEQRFTLTRGFAEITTNRGAVAILEAPCTIELIDSDNGLYLHSGKLVGLCHTEQSKGFVIKTDRVSITDLGTEFGVAVSPNGVEATVFVGEIAVKAPSVATQVITHNQTARFTLDAGQPSLVVEDQIAKGFTQRMPQPALVTAAYINHDQYKLEVVPQGVAEDARVRTDRDHEINGIDSRGIPLALLGGDLVRTPSDVKYEADYEITLDLARPATIYLLVSPFENQMPPAWLSEQYVPTQMRVGIDMGSKISGQSDPSLIGVGPGQSIDDVRIVWQRKQAEVGRVVVGRHLGTDNVYSIVVVPAPQTPSAPTPDTP